MNNNLILWPVLGQIVLTLSLYLRLLAAKKKAISAGGVDLSKTALHQEAWPDSVLKVNNNLRNQFETPILFYVVCLMLWGLKAADIPVVALSCLYVASRLAHSFIHTTSNIVKYRMPMFSLGVATLVGLLGMTAKALLEVS